MISPLLTLRLQGFNGTHGVDPASVIGSRDRISTCTSAASWILRSFNVPRPQIHQSLYRASSSSSSSSNTPSIATSLDTQAVAKMRDGWTRWRGTWPQMVGDDCSSLYLERMAGHLSLVWLDSSVAYSKNWDIGIGPCRWVCGPRRTLSQPLSNKQTRPSRQHHHQSAIQVTVERELCCSNGSSHTHSWNKGFWPTARLAQFESVKQSSCNYGSRHLRWLFLWAIFTNLHLSALSVPDFLLCFNSPLPPMHIRLQHLDISLYFCNIHIQESNVFQYFPMHNIFSFTLGCIFGMFCSSILPNHHPHLLVWPSGYDIQCGENFYSNHGRPCIMQGVSNEKRRHSHFSGGRNARKCCHQAFLVTQATVQPHSTFSANHRRDKKIYFQDSLIYTRPWKCYIFFFRLSRE